MELYTFHLLGSPEFYSADELIHLKRQKSIGILAYLAATGRRVLRNEIAAIFWPDSESSKALGALRTALTEIRNVMGSAVFSDERETITLSPGKTECYIHDFRYNIGKLTNLSEWKMAAGLWRGGFLKGFSIKNSPLFSDWQYMEEQNLLREYRNLLKKISAELIKAKLSEEALEYLRKCLVLDPYDEEIHRKLMMLYAGTGDKRSALNQYKMCRDLLERDLGFPLEQETVELCEQIKSGRFIRDKDHLVFSGIKDTSSCPRIGILPFSRNQSTEDAAAKYGEIVSESLNDLCATAAGVEVISRTSTSSYRNSDKNLSRIASELRADYIIEGYVHDYPDHIAIEAGLIDARKDSVILLEKKIVPHHSDDVIRTSEIIGKRILGELGVEIELIEKEKVDPGREWRLLGNSLLSTVDTEIQKKAIPIFEKAIELNPYDCDAWAGLSLAYLEICDIGFHGCDTNDLYEKAEGAAEKSLSINKNQPIALTVIGSIAEDRDWDFYKAEKNYMKAMLIEPDNPRHINGLVSINLRKNNFAEALKLVEKAYDLNPVNGRSISAKFWVYSSARQYRKAEMMIDEISPLVQNRLWGDFARGLIKLFIGNYREAFDILRKNREDYISHEFITLLFAEAYASAALGKKADAGELINIMTEGRENLNGFHIPLAAVYTALQEYDTALEWVGKAIEAKDPGVLFLVLYPFYDPLYQFPQYLDYLNQLHIVPRIPPGDLPHSMESTTDGI